MSSGTRPSPALRFPSHDAAEGPRYPGPMAGDILGREDEVRRVGVFLDSLSDGPAGCVLEGAAGIGKTALWRRGLVDALARSYRVLSCAPAEVEARLSFASLADLLAGIEEEVFASVPAPQRHALDVALLRADPADSAADPRAVQDGYRVGVRGTGRLDAARRCGRRCSMARPCFGRGARVCRSEARASASRLPRLAS